MAEKVIYFHQQKYNFLNMKNWFKINLHSETLDNVFENLEQIHKNFMN